MGIGRMGIGRMGIGRVYISWWVDLVRMEGLGCVGLADM
jgi:hypothetical protein